MEAHHYLMTPTGATSALAGSILVASTSMPTGGPVTPTPRTRAHSWPTRMVQVIGEKL